MLYNTEKRTLGLNLLTSDTAEFLVWAPFASSMSIDINDREIKLEKKEAGYWSSELIDISAGNKYKLIKDNQYFPDPASLYQPDGVHGHSQVTNLKSYEWKDSQWKGILPQDLIIYELHTGTFSKAGTFEGISEKLKYFRDLGITAIEIMPVAQFPGSRNWGYDGVYPFAVQNSYGGPERLQKLVDSCHAEGIALILDVVYNHLGPEGNYLPAFGPYFTDKYKTPWGQAINFDDEWCDGVRRYVIENALMWFRDFHIDGLRLDAVHAIKDFSARHILEELEENTGKLSEITGRTHLLIAESDLNDVRYINPVEKGGYQIDLQWCDEFHHALHALVTKEHDGYYSDFGSIDQVCKSFNDAFVYDGTYSNHRRKIFGNKTSGLPGHKFVVFNQNHDQVGNRMKGERLSVLVDIETLKLLTGALFFSPFVPLIFMGEEYGERNPFLYFTSHGDNDLIKAVREGRNREFSYLAEKNEVPDPQDTETFNNSKLNWDDHNEQQLNLLLFYKEVIRLRKSNPVLKSTDRQGVEAQIVADNQALILLRQHHESVIICMMNFTENEITIETEPAKSLIVLLHSSGENWNNSKVPVPDEKNVNFKIGPKSFILLSDIVI